MIEHAGLGDTPFSRSRKLKLLMLACEVKFGGNSKLKIFGRINCSSGKRMKVQNRVFFRSVTEAELMGYRPCGHCMRVEYLKWKASKNTLPN